MAIGLATIVCCRTRIAGCSVSAISCSIAWGMGTMGLVSVLGLGLGSWMLGLSSVTSCSTPSIAAQPTTTDPPSSSTTANPHH